MTFYLGIDGGGTKTSCAVGDERNVWGVGVSAGCNVVRVGEERARAGIQDAIKQACTAANVSTAHIAHTCIGAAGISSSGVNALLRQFVVEVVPAPVIVVGDHDIAFEAALGDEPGVIVIAGTGSVALGRNARGQRVRAGGYGFAISDEGSGHWIGRRALAQTLHALDRGATPPLHRLIVEAWHIQLEDLVKTANAIPPPDFSQLCPVVVQAADHGDLVATTVLGQAGAELGELAGAVLERLWAADETVPVAMVGGVFKNSTIVREQFACSLRTQHASASVQQTVSDPMMGALSLARKRGFSH